MGNTWSQLFPPKADFTVEQLPDQSGKVFLVTGSSSGVGKELCRMLYMRNAKIYMANRAEQKTLAAMEAIKAAAPGSKGELIFLHVDFEDLTTIKGSAKEFLAKESKLDVLWNNAGVMMPPAGSKTKQDYELQIGVNNLGPFLFTNLITPALIEAAKSAPTGQVRVVWVASSAAEAFTKKNGIDMSNLDYKKKDVSASSKYGVSKCGNVFHCQQYAKIHSKDGIISTVLNPGNLESGLQRHVGWFVRQVMGLVLYPAFNGAHTELFAGLSPEVTPKHNGAWIIPWGRFGPLRDDIANAAKSETEGGTGLAEKFWAWSEEQVKPYR